ncbi:class B sortase [Eubacterium sp.]|uniref:class B sortase n=1 Tax=Eubacterium sp. TaxID=142586 RepID=UPI002601568A|nr:class B sortase [Eubacterium sp.]MCR5629557.1 class B sortase [Eubacterium sp.]
MKINKVISPLIILMIATGLVLWLYKTSEIDGLHKFIAGGFKGLVCGEDNKGKIVSYGDKLSDSNLGVRKKINKNYLDFEGRDEHISREYDDIKDKYEEYKNINDDLVGIVNIEGMDFNYPVMISRTPNYYLNHDLFKNYSLFGCPYMGEGYSLINNNIVIYGHCINKDKMFGKLLSLKNKCVFSKVKSICLYTNGEMLEYEVVALLSINVEKTDYRYWEIKDFKDEKAFAGYVDGIVENGIYVSEDKLKYGNYLMLSTCDNELGGDYRIVLVGRMLEKTL